MRIITYILTMLLLLACKNNDGVNDIPFETITADKTISLSSEEHAPSCRVHLKLESATSKAGHIGELINETVIKKFLDPHGEKDMKIAAEPCTIKTAMILPSASGMNTTISLKLPHRRVPTIQLPI